MKELLELCIDINDNTDATVFLNYSGHIRTVEVELYPKGWRNTDEEYLKYVDRCIKSECMPILRSIWNRNNPNDKIEIEADMNENNFKDRIKEIKTMLNKIKLDKIN